MAAILAASIGTALLGTGVLGWYRQSNHSSNDTWDPKKYIITDEATPIQLSQNEATTLIAPLPASTPDKLQKKAKKPAVQLNETAPQETTKLSNAGESRLAMMSTKFGRIQLTPQNTVSFRRLPMPEPDQSRLNEFALAELKDMEFVVGIDDTYECPFANATPIAHQEDSVLIGAASTTPQMERVYMEQSTKNKKNISKLQQLKGCTVNIKRIGKYVLTDHLPQGDGTLSADGKTLILHKGLMVGGKAAVNLQSGDTISFRTTSTNFSKGGEFSMYKCQMGTELPDRSTDDRVDSYETCLSERLRDFDVDSVKTERDNLYFNRTARKRFTNTMTQKFQQVDTVQPPPNMERPDVYCDDVARMVRDGFPQKPGTRSHLAAGKKNPLSTARSSIALAADSHFGTMTKKTSSRRHDTVRAHASNTDPLRSLERMKRMEQTMGDMASNQGRNYTDLSGLNTGYSDKYDRTTEPRQKDYRQVNDVAELTTDQILNPGKRGGGTTDYKDFTPARTSNVRGDKTHRQVGGYMDGGMVIHEVDTGGRNITDRNVRRKDLSLDIYEQIYTEGQSADKDNFEMTQRNLRFDVSKPVVKLTQLEHIPGVMAKRGIRDLGHDLYDDQRPHTVVARKNFKKDAGSKKGVRRDYGHYTNQFYKDNDPYEHNIDNAQGKRDEVQYIEFGRQTGGSKANPTYLDEREAQTLADKNVRRRDINLDTQQQIYDERYSAAQDNIHVTDQRTDIYDFKQPGAAAMRENSHRERMSNEAATSYINRGLDAEKPVTRHRDDADIAGEGKTARISSLYSEHRERDVMNLNEGVATNRPKTYEAGLKTATNQILSNDQKVDLFRNTNATADNYRREWGEYAKGEIAGMSENGYMIQMEGGKVQKDVDASDIRARQPIEYRVGQRVNQGTISKKNEDGTYNLKLDNGSVRADVTFDRVITKAVYTLGEKVEVRTRESTVSNRTLLNNTPARYDGVLRSQKAQDGTALGVPRNAEKGTEWFRDNTLKETIDTTVVNQVTSQPRLHGQNNEMRPNNVNAMLSSGFGGVEEMENGDKVSTVMPNGEIGPSPTLRYQHEAPVVSSNGQQMNTTEHLAHRPSFQIHSEE